MECIIMWWLLNKGCRRIRGNNKAKLASASSVQAALKGLLEKDFVTQEMGTYQIYDRFLGIWLKESY